LLSVGVACIEHIDVGHAVIAACARARAPPAGGLTTCAIDLLVDCVCAGGRVPAASTVMRDVCIRGTCVASSASLPIDDILDRRRQSTSPFVT